MQQQDGFLPDFCRAGTVFRVVLTAQLLALALVLARPLHLVTWEALGLISLYVQWIALASVAILCLARPLLARLHEIAAGAAAYAVILTVTAVAGELAYRLTGPLGEIDRALFIARSVAIAAVAAAIALRYLYLAHEGERRTQRAAKAREEALAARIRPHFLFNSLNTIAALIGTEPRRAERAVEDLSTLFRAALRSEGRQTTLGDELRLAGGYLRLEQARLGERLNVRWNVEGLPQDLPLPALILQPLVENAVYHGVEPRPEGGTVAIDGHVDDQRVTLCVSNPLAHNETPRGSGVALEAVRARLRLVYGDAATLTCTVGERQHAAILELPRRPPP